VLQELHLPAYRDEQDEFRAKWKYDTYQGKREYLDDGMRASAIERPSAKAVTQDLEKKRRLVKMYCED
jgi:hypothetical protein